MYRRLPLLSIALLAALSCQDPPPPPPPLDVALGPAEARAGKVTKPSELIGGPVAYGRPGDVWKLYNDKARFLIQDVGAATGLDLYGGNLIDADIVRPGGDGQGDGLTGRDRFREAFPIVGLHGVKPSKIEVVADGTKGGPAHLRVTGTDASTDILPQIDILAQDLGGQITIDYVLAPGVPWLEVTTTYQALPGQSLTTLGLGDFVAFGGSLALFSPESGFSGDAKVVTFLTGTDDDVAIGYVYPKAALQVPIVDANGTATLLTSPPVPTSGSISVTRYFVVGPGGAASVSGAMYKLRGITTAPLDGTATELRGTTESPARRAHVTLFRAPYDAQSQPIDQALADDAGRFHFDVPPGDYVLIAGGAGRTRGTPKPVKLEAAGTTVALSTGAQGILEVDIGELINGARVTIPAKISLTAKDVEAPDPRFGPDPTESERFGLHAALLSPGGGSFPLKPGTYSAVISRGVEYATATADNIVVKADAPATLRAELVRVVDTTGWLAGDYHQHSAGSIDSGVPVRERVVENLAEGIEFPAATDHDNLTDYRPHIAALNAGRFIGAVVGNEISVNGVGHFNAYPLAIDPANPLAKVGARYWARKTVRQISETVHAEPTSPVLHVSHPRTKSLAGWFNAVKFDPTTGLSRDDFPIDNFQAIEVNGDLGAPADYLPAADAQIHKNATQSVPSGVPAMRDWFAFLNQGRTVTALGNSDTHHRNDDTGYPRSFVRLDTDDPSQPTGDQLAAAIRAQRVTVSNGPFVTVTVDGQARLGKADPVKLSAATAALGVRVQAPAWVDVATFEVYANGRPLSLERTGPNAFAERDAGTSGTTLAMPIDPGDAEAGAVRLDGVVTVKPARDTWYVVVVRGAKSMAPVTGASPYGYNNPIYVDLGGDGWTPPGL